jgi:DNA uptake protein ComE-like DNA-binding protein
MNRSGADARLAPADTATTGDKRALVLFVLGFLLIALDLLSFESKEERHRYSVSLEETTSPWRVLSVPAGATATPGHDLENEMPDSKGGRVVSFSPEVARTTDIPAVLTLFLNRPLPVNSADEETLAMLPGVGPHLAASITSELRRQGKFSGPDDLLKVPGIGPKNLQRLLPLVSFQ